MPRTRKNHPPSLKAKVALEALKSIQPMSEISQKFGVHPNLVSVWKTQASDGIQSLFENGREKSAAKSDELLAERDELFRQIGQLKVELDWLKKKSGLLG